MCLQGGAFSTIHITPEDGFSYASVELCGYDAAALDPAVVVAQTAAIFRPALLSVALSADATVPGCSWGDGLNSLAGYNPGGATSQNLPAGGRVSFYNLERVGVHAKGLRGAPLANMPAFAAQDGGAIAADLPHIADGAAAPGAGREVEVRVAPSCPPTPEALDEMLTAYSSDSDSHVSSDDGALRAPRAPKPAASTDNAALAAAVTEALADAQGLGAVLHLYEATRLVVPRKSESAVGAAQAALDAHIAELVTGRGLDDTFYVMDLGIVARLHAAWMVSMPRVEPFYAVKCNGAPHVVQFSAMPLWLC